MRRRFALLASLVALVALAVLVPVDAADPKPKKHVVEMRDNKFEPKEITITVGDSVTWVNKGKHRHNATSSDGGKTFKTGPVKPGEKAKPHKFSKTGKVPYRCTVHEGMKGTVIVKKAK